MNLKSIWAALEERSEILLGIYAYLPRTRSQRSLHYPPNFYNWVMAIWLSDTKPFTVAQFMQYFPYGLAQANEERFASAVQRGYLTSDGQGAYRATELGRTAAARS